MNLQGSKAEPFAAIAPPVEEERETPVDEPLQPAGIDACAPSVRRILHGPLRTEVFRFGVPLAVGMGLQTTFNLVDAYIISGLTGEAAGASLAAIGNCDQIAAVGTILSYGLSIAAGTLVSHKHGAGDLDGVRRVAWQSTLFLVLLSVLFGVLGLFGSEFLMNDVMQAKGAVADIGVPYLRIMMGGSFTIFLLLHLVTLKRALGSSKMPIVILVGANIMNLVLAVLFVYGGGQAPAVFAWGPPLASWLGLPRMELEGAAWATVIARMVALVPAFAVVYYRHRLFPRSVRGWFQGDVIRRIWAIGWPTSSQLVVRIVAILAVIRFAQSGFTTQADQDVSTALGVVLRWETMALFVGLGWGSASQTFMGQNLGAGNPGRARQSGWYMALYNAVMMGGFAALSWFWGDGMIRVFSNDPRVIELGVDYFRWVGPSYVALGTGVVLGSAIQGAGASKLTLVIDLAVIALVQLPLSAIVVGWFNEPTRLWQVVAITYCCFAATYVIFYRRGRFLTRGF